MVAVKGIYEGGDIVKLDTMPVPVHGPYEVVVAFLNPVQQVKDSAETVEERDARRQKAFQRFMQYRGTLPADFDYKKELAEYRNERSLSPLPFASLRLCVSSSLY
jgi:hypothetical protein